MNYTEFRTRMRRLIWIATKSPAAVASKRYGKRQEIEHWNGVSIHLRNLLDARAKDWEIMAKGKRTGFVTSIKFVDMELTADGKAAFKQWPFTHDSLISYVETRGNEGYKLGVSYKPDRGAWIASLTCVDKASPNFEYCLSAYGGDWLQAIAVLAYKDTVLLAGDWAAKHELEHNEDNFG